MSLERELRLPAHRINDVNELGLDEASLKRLQDYQRQEETHLDSALSAAMPGLMSLDEVEDEIDLGRWPLKLGNMLVHLEVSPHKTRESA